MSDGPLEEPAHDGKPRLDRGWSDTDMAAATGGDTETVEGNRPPPLPPSEKYKGLITLILTQPDQVVGTLSPDFISDLCSDAQDVLAKETSLLELNMTADWSGEGEEFVLVGDIHGQLEDMIRNVITAILPDPKNLEKPQRKILFLGDYVDRGPQGLEVISLLLALKITWPNDVFLLRGNHEDAQISRMYGFLAEIRNKLGSIDAWVKFNQIFNFIPIAAVLGTADGKKRLFAVHGGLSPNLQELSTLACTDRQDYGGMLAQDLTDIIDGALWSDPSDESGFQMNERGCGYLFGENESIKFCTQHEIDFIVRAHQMVLEGYQWAHQNRVLTLFSAPNYCGIADNKGAIAYVDKELGMRFVCYEAWNKKEPESSPTEFVGSPKAPVAGPPSYFQ